MAEAARACSNQRRALIGSWVTLPRTGVIEIEGGGDENITINHSCDGGDCGGGSNSGGDDSGDGDGGDGGDGGNGGGRESDGGVGVGCSRAVNDGGYSGGKSNNVTTVTGTVAMGLAVVAVAKATMMALCQCMRVKHLTTQVAAVVTVVAAADGEDSVQWRRWGGVFDG